MADSPTASYVGDLAALTDLVKRYGSMVALVNVSPKEWRSERQSTADNMLRQIIDAFAAAGPVIEAAREMVRHPASREVLERLEDAVDALDGTDG